MAQASIKVYEYPKCSTCVKALKFLAATGQNFEKLDITLTPPTPVELRAMIAQYAGDFRKVFNTSGVQYRELKLADRMDDMTEAEAVKLLSGNGKLVKRPFLLKGLPGTKNFAGVVGFREATWQELLA